MEEGIDNIECHLKIEKKMKNDKNSLVLLIQKSLIIWQINFGQMKRLEDRLTYVIRKLETS